MFQCDCATVCKYNLLNSSTITSLKSYSSAVSLIPYTVEVKIGGSLKSIVPTPHIR